MQSIWISRIVLKPAGPLTFRQMPSGLLHIMSYPFMPPTTLSGFLARLMLISEGKEWPGYGIDWFGENETTIENSDNSGTAVPTKKKKGKKNDPKTEKAGYEYTLTLDKAYRCLGAFPDPERWRVHKTRRHGPKNFKHTEFSELLRTNHKANYQLHHWDYLFCEEMTGWVVSIFPDCLQVLSNLVNFGGKSGKEGFVVVKAVDEPVEVVLKKGKFKPIGLVAQPARPDSGTFYNLYAHYWDDNYLWSDNSRGGVAGYTQLGAWWNVSSMDGYYWALSEGVGLCANAVDAFLVGQVDKIWKEQQ